MATQDIAPQVIHLLGGAHKILIHFLQDAEHNSIPARNAVSKLQELSRQLQPALPSSPILSLRSPFTRAEKVALLRARLRSWLEVTSAVGEGALQHWQQICERKRKPFALSRPETTRTGIWLVLPEGSCWTPMQRELLENLRVSLGAVIWDEHSLRAFVPPRREGFLFSRLLSASY